MDPEYFDSELLEWAFGSFGEFRDHFKVRDDSTIGGICVLNKDNIVVFNFRAFTDFRRKKLHVVVTETSCIEVYKTVNPAKSTQSY